MGILTQPPPANFGCLLQTIYPTIRKLENIYRYESSCNESIHILLALNNAPFKFLLKSFRRITDKFFDDLITTLHRSNIDVLLSVMFNALVLVHLLHLTSLWPSTRVFHDRLVKWGKTNWEKVYGCL